MTHLAHLNIADILSIAVLALIALYGVVVVACYVIERRRINRRLNDWQGR